MGTPQTGKDITTKLWDKLDEQIALAVPIQRKVKLLQANEPGDDVGLMQLQLDKYKIAGFAPGLAEALCELCRPHFEDYKAVVKHAQARYKAAQAGETIETPGYRKPGERTQHVPQASDQEVNLSYWLAKQLGVHVDDLEGESLVETVQRLMSKRAEYVPPSEAEQEAIIADAEEKARRRRLVGDTPDEAQAETPPAVDKVAEREAREAAIREAEVATEERAKPRRTRRKPDPGPSLDDIVDAAPDEYEAPPADRQKVWDSAADKSLDQLEERKPGSKARVEAALAAARAKAAERNAETRPDDTEDEQLSNHREDLGEVDRSQVSESEGSVAEKNPHDVADLLASLEDA